MRMQGRRRLKGLNDFFAFLFAVMILKFVLGKTFKNYR